MQEVVVYGFNPPPFALPRNFTFWSVSSTPYPAEKWSNALIEFLQSQQDSHFVLLLCDYWLSRTVDVRGVSTLYDYVHQRPNVLRMDLTDDRLYAGGMFNVEGWGSYDIIETPAGTPYQLSTQAGIWNRQLFLQLLKPNESGWDVEIHTSPPPEMRVLGTRQTPVRYANALLKGKLDPSQLERLDPVHRNHVLNMVPEEYKRLD